MSVSYTWPSLPTYFTYLASVRVRTCDPFLLYFRLRMDCSLGHPGLSRAETRTVWLLTSSSAAPILSPAQVVVAALLSRCPLGLNLPLMVPGTPHPTSFAKSWSTYPLSVKIFWVPGQRPPSPGAITDCSSDVPSLNSADRTPCFSLTSGAWIRSWF